MDYYLIPIPRSIGRESRFTPTEKAVLLVLLSYQPCYVTHWQVQSFTGLSLGTVKKALRDLKQLGVLSRVGRVYSVELDPSRWDLTTRQERDWKERKAKAWKKAATKALGKLDV